MTNCNTEPPYRPRKLFYVLVPLLACLLTLGAIELGLTIFHPIPFSIESNMYYEADPYTGFELKPGGIGHFQMGIPAVANSHGQRDIEVPLKKPPGVFRILVLGDSFTVGTNVRQEEAYPKGLERRLRTVYGPRIQIVNSGVGGWQPIQYAEYYEHYGYRFEPDLILVGFFVGNDAYDDLTSIDQLYTAILGHRVSREAAARPFIKLQVFLYDHSNLVRLWLNQGPVEPDTYIRKQCDDFSEQYLAIQKEKKSNHLRYSKKLKDRAQFAVNHIGRIRELAGNSVPVIVSLLPDENQINQTLQKRIFDTGEIPDYDFKMPQSMLAGMFHEIGVPTIDLLPVMLADRRCLYMNDTHWTPEGQELAASAIFDQLTPILGRMNALR
jgi:hypothetical protein